MRGPGKTHGLTVAKADSEPIEKIEGPFKLRTIMGGPGMLCGCTAEIASICEIDVSVGPERASGFTKEKGADGPFKLIHKKSAGSVLQIS